MNKWFFAFLFGLLSLLFASNVSAQTAILPGDIDGDGDVDIFDYNILIGEFGEGGGSVADLDGDNDVDIFDYNILVSNFGEVAKFGISLAMVEPPVDKVCDYDLVVLRRGDLVDQNSNFDPSYLDMAQSCGTKVAVRLHNLTSSILNDNGIGLNLERFEDKINDFSGLIDTYIDNGTIVAHFTIDEPHDCSDWGGLCPDPSLVDQAGQISRKYWPNLQTLVNTLSSYVSSYNWQYTDIVNYQYAYSKGLLEQFINDGVKVINDGNFDAISWSIQAVSGGCNVGKCPMTPQQVFEVGKAMCDSGKGEFVGFYRYDQALLSAEMLQSIGDVRNYCGGNLVEPTPSDIPTLTLTPTGGISTPTPTSLPPSPTSTPLPSPTSAPGSYDCSHVIGFSQTSQWWSGFESVVNNARWELKWRSYGAIERWADPTSDFWNTNVMSSCSQNSSWNAERVLLTITGCPTDRPGACPPGTTEKVVAEDWVEDIQSAIVNIIDKYPRVRRIDLQPVVGGPGNQICYLGSSQVRASVNHPVVDAAISLVVAQNTTGLVFAGYSPEVSTCSGFSDVLGHLSSSGGWEVGQDIGRYYGE